MIKSMKVPAVVWMLNLLFFFFWDSGFFPGACFDVAEGQISILIKKGLFSVLKMSNQQTSNVTDKGSNSSEQPEPSLCGGPLISALYYMKLKGACLWIVVDPGCHWKAERVCWLMLLFGQPWTTILQPNKKIIAAGEQKRSADVQPLLAVSQTPPGLWHLLSFSCVRWEDIYLFIFVL